MKTNCNIEEYPDKFCPVQYKIYQTHFSGQNSKPRSIEGVIKLKASCVQIFANIILKSNHNKLPFMWKISSWNNDKQYFFFTKTYPG